jgi:hypothetical protein
MKLIIGTKIKVTRTPNAIKHISLKKTQQKNHFDSTILILISAIQISVLNRIFK